MVKYNSRKSIVVPQERYIKTPPEDMTADEIRDMSDDDLLDMDYFLHEFDVLDDDDFCEREEGEAGGRHRCLHIALSYNSCKFLFCRSFFYLCNCCLLHWNTTVLVASKLYNTMMEEIRDAIDQGCYKEYKEAKLAGMTAKK